MADSRNMGYNYVQKSTIVHTQIMLSVLSFDNWDHGNIMTFSSFVKIGAFAYPSQYKTLEIRYNLYGKKSLRYY